jgi:transcriptional regulator GlxA family with amidase domain
LRRKSKQHDDKQILAAQQWIESNFSSDFLLEEVADKVGLGLRSFMRRFKKAAGATALHYLQRVRIETAKELLRNSSLSIEQISYRVGYEDTSFFCRLFKRNERLTPGDYRSTC